MSDGSLKNIVLNPSLDEAYEILNEGFAKRYTILMVGEFSVQYRGRAESKLGLGERILIVKRDGAVLVHRPEGYEPVNWQPPGGIIRSEIEDDRLVVNAVKRKPREVLRLAFRRIDMLALLKLKDQSHFYLYASEEDMRNAILSNPDLIEQDFRPTSFEKKVEPGFIDIYGVDRDGKFVVIEVKRGAAGREAVLQLFRYVKSIKREVGGEVRGILVSPQLRKGVQRMLESLGLEYRLLDPKKCSELLKSVVDKKLSEFLKTQHASGED